MLGSFSTETGFPVSFFKTHKLLSFIAQFNEIFMGTKAGARRELPDAHDVNVLSIVARRNTNSKVSDMFQVAHNLCAHEF